MHSPMVNVLVALSAVVLLVLWWVLSEVGPLVLSLVQRTRLELLLVALLGLLLGLLAVSAWVPVRVVPWLEEESVEPLVPESVEPSPTRTETTSYGVRRMEA